MWDKLKIKYENDIEDSFLSIELDETCIIEDYQLQMLQNNYDPYILSANIRIFNDSRKLFYKITSKTMLSQSIKKAEFGPKEFTKLVVQINRIIVESKRLYLNYENFLLNKDLIYINPANLELYLIYVPINQHIDFIKEYRNFIIDLIMDISNTGKNDYDGYVTKIITYIKHSDFRLVEFSKILEEFPLNESNNGEKESDMLKDKAEIKHYPMLPMFVAIAALAILFSPLNDNKWQSLAGIGLILLASIGLVFYRIKNRETNIEASGYKQIPQAIINPRAIIKDNMNTVCINQDSIFCYLIDLKGEFPEKILINKQDFIIGRLKEQTDYQINSNSVGKIHAEISMEENTPYLIDLNSKNGTFINNVRINSNQKYLLTNKDLVKFANDEYTFINPIHKIEVME